MPFSMPALRIKPDESFEAKITWPETTPKKIVVKRVRTFFHEFIYSGHMPKAVRRQLKADCLKAKRINKSARHRLKQIAREYVNGTRKPGEAWSVRVLPDLLAGE